MKAKYKAYAVRLGFEIQQAWKVPPLFFLSSLSFSLLYYFFSFWFIMIMCSSVHAGRSNDVIEFTSEKTENYWFIYDVFDVGQ